jgi:periplasmic protein TonB
MKSILFIFFLFLIKFSTAQHNETIMFADENGRPAKEKNAALLIQQLQISDSLWQTNIYEPHRMRIKSVETKDASGRVANGKYITYDYYGYTDTLGYYVENKRNKVWEIYNKGNFLKQIIYEDGKIIREKDSSQIKAEFTKYSDSIKALGLGKSQMTESKFIGGDLAWQKYMLKNLRYPESAIDQKIQGTVIVRFTITKEGKVEDAEIFKSVEFSLDREALQLIQNCPSDWEPAFFNDAKVDSYKKQPIVFRSQSF